VTENPGYFWFVEGSFYDLDTTTVVLDHFDGDSVLVEVVADDGEGTVVWSEVVEISQPEGCETTTTTPPTTTPPTTVPPTTTTAPPAPTTTQGGTASTVVVVTTAGTVPVQNGDTTNGSPFRVAVPVIALALIAGAMVLGRKPESD
jgi:hypothetical protein